MAFRLKMGVGWGEVGGGEGGGEGTCMLCHIWIGQTRCLPVHYTNPTNFKMMALDSISSILLLLINPLSAAIKVYQLSTIYV